MTTCTRARRRRVRPARDRRPAGSVPPPRPEVTKTMFGPVESLRERLAVLERGVLCRPRGCRRRRYPWSPEPHLELHGRAVRFERLAVGVRGHDSTPATPAAIIRLIAFPPPPPTPYDRSLAGTGRHVLTAAPSCGALAALSIVHRDISISSMLRTRLTTSRRTRCAPAAELHNRAGGEGDPPVTTALQDPPRIERQAHTASRAAGWPTSPGVRPGPRAPRAHGHVEPCLCDLGHARSRPAAAGETDPRVQDLLRPGARTTSSWIT